ncbi:transketolase [Candidatus Daviesbacteria bacterium]|nr:transketolase [Candidatus Daviesbacteria bacterium]
MSGQYLVKLAKASRYLSLLMSSQAGSGHPTSSLSATDLMISLLFGGFFRADLNNPSNPNNDRLIFSKGHASPLFYSLFYLAGKINDEELATYRKIGSALEGHPRPVFPYAEAATGSLGQGLSIGLGMALNAKYLDKLPYKTFVLLGDSEMTEGSVWEALQLASHYKLDNLIGIIDVNGLGQRGKTMYGHDLKAYEKKAKAFGWNAIPIDGHSFSDIAKAYTEAFNTKGLPTMIIAKTIKGKGVSFLQNKDGWHGKALKTEELEKAKQELGDIDMKIRGKVEKPTKVKGQKSKVKTTSQNSKVNYQEGEQVATRKAYGNALARIFPQYPNIVVLDAEVGNSTYAEIFGKAYPEHFFEMYIAEQNMAGTALGLSRRGKIPFISTFAAFLTRAHDQIRMSQYSEANIKVCGSHAGVSIGEDGPSQMGLEDIAMFRSMLNSVVLYPSDAISTEKLTEEAAKHEGNVYIRTTRKDTPILYKPDEDFPIGGSKTLKKSSKDLVTVVGAGITLHEALAAFEELKKEGILIRVIDLYSIKPVDTASLKKAAKETKAIIVVEDHFPEGGIAEAVGSALFHLGGENLLAPRVISLAVRKIVGSGKPEELLDFEGISKESIIKTVLSFRTPIKSG